MNKSTDYVQTNDDIKLKVCLELLQLSSSVTDVVSIITEAIECWSSTKTSSYAKAASTNKVARLVIPFLESEVVIFIEKAANLLSPIQGLKYVFDWNQAEQNKIQRCGKPPINSFAAQLTGRKRKSEATVRIEKKLKKTEKFTEEEQNAANKAALQCTAF